MRVLVTGGAGFIGSHVVDYLLDNACQVAVVDNLSTGRRENLNPAANFYRLDITNTSLGEVFSSFQPDAVIHLAAQASVSKSTADPCLDARVNILGTINILECCRRFKVNNIVYASSAAIYGQPQYLPVDENHPVQPASPYGISKYTPERYLQAYADLHGIRYAVLRYSNVYGPRQDPYGEGGVVAIFTEQMLQKRQPTIYGDGEQTRDFIYVKDIAAANWLALFKGDNQVMNISTGQETSVNQLYQSLSEILSNISSNKFCDSPIESAAPSKSIESSVSLSAEPAAKIDALQKVDSVQSPTPETLVKAALSTAKAESPAESTIESIVEAELSSAGIISAVKLASNAVETAALESPEALTTTVSQTGASLQKISQNNLLPQYVEERPGDIRHSCLNNQKARELLGWNPAYNLRQGLKETVEYYMGLKRNTSACPEI